MSYLVAAPELLASAATDLSNIGSALSAANAAAAAPTSGVLAAGADEVSGALASLFSGHGQAFQALSARAAAFHAQFVQALDVAGPISYRHFQRMNPMTEPRRTRRRLSIGETDATWLYTATNSLYRFHDGRWECSQNVYYGKDLGWFGWGSDPTASDGHVFIEMLPNQRDDDPEFVDIIARFNQDTANPDVRYSTEKTLNEDEIRQMHQLEMFRNGSGNGECSPFPFDNPVCGWSGHHSQHAAHVDEMIAAANRHN